jgi:Ca-activated chloride channel family protein
VTFLAGVRLWLFVGLALLVAVYVRRQFGRHRYAVRFTNLALLDSVAPIRPGWRRHVSAGALLLALASLLAAFARPARATPVPVLASTVVVAVDVSGSMGSTDVVPDRLRAAQSAAGGFVDRLPAGFAVGLVAFDDNASVVVAPTTDHAEVKRAIGQLQTGGGTAIGEAIFAALHSMGLGDRPAVGPAPTARIVLMSDGATNAGRSNEDAAHAAAAAHVPVTTIAFGTDNGRVVLAGRQLEVPVDKPALSQIAGETGGRAFEAASAPQLDDVYNTIRTSVSHSIRKHDISAWFVGIGIVLLVATAAASLSWSPRLP